ncbi:MAG: hypothetical protein R3E01_09385 [Pirellulaceae bacterium]|nr:hypothetical protein [Planctomycetales bacterium]
MTKQITPSNLLVGRRFVWCQVAILACVAVGVVYGASAVNSRLPLPELNEYPRQVQPTYDYPFMVSDRQLSSVLERIHPKFSENPTKVNFIDHGIRLWGVDAQFEDGSFSGKQMLAMLLQNGTFSANWGDKSPPLLQRTVHGVSVSTQEGKASVSHVDHLMGTLAELQLPLSYPISTGNGPAEVRDILQHALTEFRLNQREYEWTALAAAFYCTDGRAWQTCEGQVIDFDTLADRLMRQQQPQGVCYGMHRVYTLTMFLRIDEQMRPDGGQPGLLSPVGRHAVEEYLQEITRSLYATQSDEGYWDGNWPDLSHPVKDPGTGEISRRILATGHALEWWAMAPEHLHPPRETMVRASQWLVATIEEMDPAQVEKNYTFLTHAARALALWRGCSAAEFERRQATAGIGEGKENIVAIDF